MSAIFRFPKRYPFAFAVGFTSFKTGLADYLVQTYVEKNEVCETIPQFCALQHFASLAHFLVLQFIIILISFLACWKRNIGAR